MSWMKLEYEVILEWVKKGSSVLDLGCGTGDLLEALVKNNAVKAQGLEIDEKAIYECVAKGLSVIHQDIETGLPEYLDRSFDYVILAGSLQQVKKPDTVLTEAQRVGRKTIVSFPNFGHYRVRTQIFFGGKVPVTPSLPFEWYNTPNLHFLSISNFIDYCKKRNIHIEKSAFLSQSRVKVLPNLRAETAVFMLSA
ncbi:MAG: methionine biosynthesis protein MetW [Nitrososphaerota archaeon]|nr:methionine biosynthesis protein MetW [Nitrososphaerota archaeon]